MLEENESKYMIHKKIKIPDSARHFIFSDVHGKKKEVDALIKSVNGTDHDYYTFVGDVIDRGPNNSVMLFDVLMRDNFNMSLGNHEYMMLEAIHNPQMFDLWTYRNHKKNIDNGGLSTLRDIYFNGMEFFEDLLLKKCPIILEIEHRGKTFGIVHAEIPLIEDYFSINSWNKVIKQAKKDEDYYLHLLQGRSVHTFIRDNTDTSVRKILPSISGIDFIIHGHSGIPNILNHENMYWIDTGFVSNRISMMEYDFEKGSFERHILNQNDYLKTIENNDIDLTSLLMKGV